MKFRIRYIFFIIVCLLIACSDGFNRGLNILNDLNTELLEPVEVTDMTDEAWATLECKNETWYKIVPPPDPALTEALRMKQKEFYNRYIDADGIAVIGNDRTLDVHFKNARKVILIMTAKHLHVRDAFRGCFYIIVAGGTGKSIITDNSGNAWFEPGSDWDDGHIDLVPELGVWKGAWDNTQGFPWGGTLSTGTLPTKSYGWRTPDMPPVVRKPVVKFGWCVAQAVWGQEMTMTAIVHEFAHALHFTLRYFDPAFPEKLEHAFENAKEKGLWINDDKLKGMVEGNIHHFWTGVLHVWYFDIGSDKGNIFETVEDFYQYDPVMGELIEEWFVHVPMQDMFSAKALKDEILEVN